MRFFGFIDHKNTSNNYSNNIFLVNLIRAFDWCMNCQYEIFRFRLLTLTVPSGFRNRSVRVTTVPLPSHYRPTTVPLPSHYRTTTVPLPSHYRPTTVPLPSHYRPTTVPLPSHYRPTTVPLPSHYRPTTVPLPPIQLFLIIQMSNSKTNYRYQTCRNFGIDHSPFLMLIPVRLLKKRVKNK
jgi:hypothetical protein